MKSIIMILIMGMALLMNSCLEQTGNPAAYPGNLEKSGSAQALTLDAENGHNSLEADKDDDADANIPKCILLPAIPDWPTVSFDLEKSEFEGDILALTVSYSGGCISHEFRLVVSTVFENTDLPRISTELFHTPNYDPCDQWVTEVRRFDMTPLKELLLDRHPDASCLDAIIQIQNAGPKDRPLVYRVCQGDHLP